MAETRRSSGWTTLDFGRHNGRTLPQVVLIDPDWFFYALEKGWLQGDSLVAEAKEVASKARVPPRVDGP